MSAHGRVNRILSILQGAVKTTVTFDNNGDLTEENANGSRTTNIFDQENRLIGIRRADGTRSTYTYDGDGLRRTAEEPGAAKTTFIWNRDDYLGEY